VATCSHTCKLTQRPNVRIRRFRARRPSATPNTAETEMPDSAAPFATNPVACTWSRPSLPNTTRPNQRCVVNHHTHNTTTYRPRTVQHLLFQHNFHKTTMVVTILAAMRVADEAGKRRVPQSIVSSYDVQQ
jgi:hypothetical protein